MPVTVAQIEQWHKAQGFDEIGYHFVVLPNGTICRGRDIDKVGAHCKGHNAASIGIAYIGGVDEQLKPCDTRTPQQIHAMYALCYALRLLFGQLKISAHYEYSSKACPCFDIDELRNSFRVR